MERYVAVVFILTLLSSTFAAQDVTEEESLEESHELQSREDDDPDSRQDIDNWNGDLTVFENNGGSSKGQLPSQLKKEKRIHEKKMKIKKKDKKMLMEILTAGLLIKSAFLPLAVGFLKLLTGKALMVTMMALTLILAITFRSAKEKPSSSTEVINLVGHGHHKHRAFRSLDLASRIMPIVQDIYPTKFNSS